jgi:hypothetical protein
MKINKLHLLLKAPFIYKKTGDKETLTTFIYARTIEYELRGTDYENIKIGFLVKDFDENEVIPLILNAHSKCDTVPMAWLSYKGEKIQGQCCCLIWKEYYPKDPKKPLCGITFQVDDKNVKNSKVFRTLFEKLKKEDKAMIAERKAKKKKTKIVDIH